MLAVGRMVGPTTSDSINLTGNSSDQGLFGNNANNVLNGKGGNDLLVGAAGNDILIGDAGDDGFMSGDGDDSMSGGDGGDFFMFNQGSAQGQNYTGNTGILALTGGADTADGGAGRDTIFMRGKLDDYIISRVSAEDYKITVIADIPDVSSTEEMVFKNIERLAFGDSSALTSGNLDSNAILLSTINIISNFDDKLTSPSLADWSVDGLAGNDLIVGGSGNDTIIGGLGADTLTGAGGKDTFFFASGASGQSTGFDIIADFIKGAVGMGDVIDFSESLVIGGDANVAKATEASINQSTGVVKFDKKSGETLADAIGDIATRFTAASDTAGEFAFFKIKNVGDFYLFISDGVAGVTANDVVVQLAGVSSINSIDLTGNNLAILS
jgi:Ca2+-binding RTX toxin-like protein